MVWGHRLLHISKKSIITRYNEKKRNRKNKTEKKVKPHQLPISKNNMRNKKHIRTRIVYKMKLHEVAQTKNRFELVQILL